MTSRILIITLMAAIFSMGTLFGDRLGDLMKDGKYQEVVNIAGKSWGIKDRLYLGLAYHCMMLNKTISGSQKGVYRDKALSALRYVCKNSKNADNAARAYIYRAYTIHLNYTTLKKKREALGLLHRVQTMSWLKNSTSYNDSLLFSALIYKQMGWYAQARTYYKKLRTANKKDNYVFNPEEMLWNTPLHAGNHGLALVKKICYSGGAKKKKGFFSF